MPSAEDRAAIEFIWNGQTGLAELAWDYDKRIHLPVAAALATLHSYRVYAPLLRAQPRSIKNAVAAVGNVIWTDLDSRDGLNRIKDFASKQGITPSLVVDSGNKGFWLYLKLDQLIATDTIEALNKGLLRLVEGDRGSWNRDRLARLPGSIHPESKRTAQVVALTGAIHDPASLMFLEGVSGVTPPEPELLISDQKEGRTGHLEPLPRLRGDLRNYIDRKPEKGSEVDRSAVEQAIFTTLVRQGWSESEIIEYANFHELPRHRQEYARHRDYRWTIRSIENAKAYLNKYASPDSTQSVSPLNSNSLMCMENDTRSPYDRRLEALRLVSTPMLAKDAVALFGTQLGCSSRTGYRIISQLEAGGYVSLEGVRGHGTVRRTSSGDAAANSRFRPALLMPKATGDPFVDIPDDLLSLSVQSPRFASLQDTSVPSAESNTNPTHTERRAIAIQP